MRLELVGRIPELNLPWTAPLSSWPGHLFRTQGCRPGEEWHLRGEGSRVALEVEAGRGREAFALLSELATYGLPVAKPLALAEEREHADDLLVLELPAPASPLGEALMAESPPSRRGLQATASLLVLLHLAGLEGRGHARWRFALSTAGKEPGGVLIYAEGKLREQVEAEARASDLSGLQSSLRRAALEAFFEGDQAQQFAADVASAYGELWREIEGTRLFIESEIQLQTRVVTLASVPEPQRQVATGGVALNCQVVERRGMGLLLQLLTGFEARGERGRMLLQDIFRYHAWLEFSSGRRWPRALAANRWLADCFLPAVSILPHEIGKQMIGRGC